MGKYDQYLVGLSSSSSLATQPIGKVGKYDQFLAGLNSPVDLPNTGDSNYAEELEPGIYGETSPFGQRILENLGAAAGGYGIGNLATRGAIAAGRSNLGKALLNSPKSLGKQYAAQDAAVGVRRTIPETSTRAVFEDPYKYPSLLEKAKYAQQESLGPKLVDSSGKALRSTLPTDPVQGYGPTSISRPRPQIPAEALPTTIPEKLPRNFAGFKKFAENRIDKFGDKLTSQELMNYKVHIETQMASDAIPKFSKEGKITTIYQQASALRDKVAQTFKKVMDSELKGKSLPKGFMKSRSELDRANSLSHKIRNIPGKVWSGTKKASKVGAVIGGLGLGGYTLRRALGG